MAMRIHKMITSYGKCFDHYFNKFPPLILLWYTIMEISFDNFVPDFGA